MVLYHPLEHAAFFHDVGVLKFLSESNVARLWRLACSVWLAYVVCDMPTNFLQLQQVRRAPLAALTHPPSPPICQTLEPDVRPPGPVSVKSTLRANQIKRIKTYCSNGHARSSSLLKLPFCLLCSDVLVLLLLRNFVDFPLVLHFSLDGVRQVLSPRTRVVLSLLSSLLNIARLWRRADLPAADQDDDEDD